MEKKDIFRKSNLERISSPEQLNDYIKIVNPSVILMIAGLIILLAGGLVWGVLGTIPVTANGEGAFYSSQGAKVCDQMVCILDANTASKLREGLEVQVSPDTAARDTYGYIRGKITSISQYPVGIEEVTKLVGNERLAQSIMSREAGTEVIITLDRDSTSENGLAWSSSEGKKVEVHQGITGNALMILKNQRPIDLVLKSKGV